MKVFLSSTYIDLIKHRKAAHDVLERTKETANVVLDQLEKRDLSVGTYAYCYGFIPEGSEISITEQEYVHARSKSRPVLCFVVDEDHPCSPMLVEKDAGKIKKLKISKPKS